MDLILGRYQRLASARDEMDLPRIASWLMRRCAARPCSDDSAPTLRMQKLACHALFLEDR